MDNENGGNADPPGSGRWFQVLIAAGEGGLTVDSKAQAEQVRTVDFQRLRHRLGTVKPDTMSDLAAALRIHLGV